MPVARPHAALQAGPEAPLTPDSSPTRQRPAVAIMGPRPALLNVEEVCDLKNLLLRIMMITKHRADALQRIAHSMLDRVCTAIHTHHRI